MLGTVLSVLNLAATVAATALLVWSQLHKCGLSDRVLSALRHKEVTNDSGTSGSRTHLKTT